MRNFVRIKIFLALLLLLACEKEIPWDTESIDGRFLVIDGILTNEQTRQMIYISRTNSEMNLPSEPVSGLEVSVSSNFGTYVFIESEDKKGMYYSDELRVVVRRDYQLSVSNGSRVFEAEASAEPVTRLGKLAVQWNEEKELYSYVANTTGDPAMTEVSYDWSVDETYCTSYGNCQASEAVYILDNVDVNEEFGPTKEIIYFPEGTSIYRKKYSLSDQHQRFVRSLLMETEWRGGLFDVQQGNIPGNISNAARGFFAVCMVDTDSAVVE